MKYFFNDMEFEVPDSVYYPKEDSELLASAISEMDVKGKQALEIGCGSGLISILLAKAGASVTAVDINPKAVLATKKNAEKNGFKFDAHVSNMFENVDGKFDIIVFNPPYLPVGEDDDEDITYSGGSTGREYIEIFISFVKNHLNEKGKILMVISSLTGEKEVIELFGQIRMSAKIIARQKIPWEQLIVILAE